MHRHLLYLLFSLFTLASAAQEKALQDSFLQRARNLAGEGEYEKARELLQPEMARHPEDRDLKTLYAKTFSWEGTYGEARDILNSITSYHRTDREAWTASARNEIYAGNLSLALGLVNKALIHMPADPALLELRRSILAQTMVENDKVPDPIPETKKEEKPARELPASPQGIFVRSSAKVFSSTFKPMYSQTVGMEMTGRMGRLIPAVQFDQRFDQEGIQYQLDAYPRFSKKFYGYLSYAYSKAGIFPEHRGGGELFYNSESGWEASAGARYYQFLDDDALVYTGSAGKYSGNYYLALRTFVTPKNGQPAISGLFTARKYYRDALTYLGFSAGYGFSTELQQLRDGQELLAETLFFVATQQAGVEYQWHNAKSSAWKASLRAVRQEFAFNPGAYFLSFNVGLEYRLLIP